MLRTGCVILSLWALLNLVLSAGIIFDTMVRGGHTPALYLLLTEETVESLDPDVVATMDSIAVFANGLNTAFCALALCVIWLGLHRRRPWAFWSLLAGFSLAVLAGVGADVVVGLAAPQVNAISAAILGLGFALAGADLFRHRDAADAPRGA